MVGSSVGKNLNGEGSRSFLKAVAANTDKSFKVTLVESLFLIPYKAKFEILDSSASEGNGDVLDTLQSEV
ncbi:hypothetical protein SUGI_0650880 [Cryptomeria japonica]|nr:hypothetical protein SUGI_0650880 [Cryptomeria japonica]